MLARVRERIAAACARAGRAESDVTLVAVTKGHGVDEIASKLVAVGQLDLGENRVSEWRDKADALGAGVRWHMIGHLQTNKVRQCMRFALLHGIDSPRLIEALEAEGAKRGHVFPVLIQVNVSGEDTKYGVAPGEVADLVARVADSEYVRLEGLMTMAPHDPDPERARPHFRALHALAVRHAHGRTSMGMSGDFEVAIEEGATWVRIGSALFAP